MWWSQRPEETRLAGVKPLGERPGWDGHLVLLYNEEAQRRTGVAAWVRRGLELGAKILYTEPPGELPDRSLPGVLQDQPDAEKAVERGQIQVIPASDTAYDPDWQASVVQDALDQGYPSVRWSGEATTAWGVMPRARHADIERATDQLCRSLPVSALCQYPARESMEVLRLVSTVHGSGLRERLFQASPFEGGLAVAGEIDVSNHDILYSLLLAATAATGGSLFVLELSRLDFLDVGGSRTLMAGTASYRSRGGQVRLQAPQPHVDRLIRTLAIDRARGILTEEMS